MPRENTVKRGMEAAQGEPNASMFRSGSSVFSHAVSVCALRNRLTGQRRDVADNGCARWKGRSWDKAPIPLPRRRTIGVRCWVTGHTRTRKGIDVGVRCCESVSECLQEGNDLVLLLIRQAEIAGRHVKILLDLGHWPAVYFFGRSWRAVSGRYRERKLFARIVEVYELLRAL